MNFLVENIVEVEIRPLEYNGHPVELGTHGETLDGVLGSLQPGLGEMSHTRKETPCHPVGSSPSCALTRGDDEERHGVG